MNANRRRNPQIRRLIEQIFQKREYSDDGLRAIKTLATKGEPALRQMLAALEHPPKNDQHPVDLWDTIHRVFQEFARIIPDSVMDLMDEGALSPRYGYWALGSARGRRSIDVLIAGLKHNDPEVRWDAAQALVQRRTRRAVPALLAVIVPVSLLGLCLFGIDAWHYFTDPRYRLSQRMTALLVPLAQWLVALAVTVFVAIARVVGRETKPAEGAIRVSDQTS